MSPPRNWIMPSISFKLAFNVNTRRYQVDPNWKLDDFWNIMKSTLIRDFGIEQFELVEAGQNTDISENGVAFNKNENIRLCEKYGPSMNVSFYIRPIILHQQQIIQQQIIQQQMIQQQIIQECFVCYEQMPLISPYRCIHMICSICYNECRNHYVNTCPMCRGH